MSIARANLPAVMFLMAVGALAIALISQHAFGFNPCPWCIFQRVLYLAIAAAAGLAWILRRQRMAATALMTVAVLSALATVATAAYQHFVSAPSGSCAMTWPDRQIAAHGLDELAPWFFQVSAACDEADRAMAGLPYSVWSMIVAGVLAVLAGIWLASRRGAGQPLGSVAGTSR